MSRTGIVIVTHNSGAEIGPCLDAALPAAADVIVIDNASQDATVDRLRERNVRSILCSRNRGFAAAVNLGFRALDTPLVLLLNPDVILQTGIEALEEACDRPQAAGAAGRLVDAREQVQVGFNIRRLPTPLALSFEALLLNRVWPRNPVNWQYRCLGLDYGAELCVEQPAGAFLMIRREVWDQLGGFDEDFHPIWFEDVDFCKRALDLGLSFRYVPGVVGKHTGGHSISSIPLEFRQFYWYRSLLKYTAKHFGSRSQKMVCLAVMFGSVLRMVLGMACQRSWKPIAVYSSVVRLAGRHFISGLGSEVEVLSLR